MDRQMDAYYDSRKVPSASVRADTGAAYVARSDTSSTAVGTSRYSSAYSDTSAHNADRTRSLQYSSVPVRADRADPLGSRGDVGSTRGYAARYAQTAASSLLRSSPLPSSSLPTSQSSVTTADSSRARYMLDTADNSTRSRGRGVGDVGSSSNSVGAAAYVAGDVSARARSLINAANNATNSMNAGLPTAYVARDSSRTRTAIDEGGGAVRASTTDGVARSSSSRLSVPLTTTDSASSRSAYTSDYATATSTTGMEYAPRLQGGTAPVTRASHSRLSGPYISYPDSPEALPSTSTFMPAPTFAAPETLRKAGSSTTRLSTASHRAEQSTPTPTVAAPDATRKVEPFPMRATAASSRAEQVKQTVTSAVVPCRIPIPRSRAVTTAATSRSSSHTDNRDNGTAAPRLPTGGSGMPDAPAKLQRAQSDGPIVSSDADRSQTRARISSRESTSSTNAPLGHPSLSATRSGDSSARGKGTLSISSEQSRAGVGMPASSDERGRYIEREVKRADSARRVMRSPRGLVGLVNLGNTCFMNSCLQCLSNIPPLSEYFLSGEFKADLNRSSSTKGEAALAYAELLQRLWSGGTGGAERPDRVKKIVGVVASRFLGYDQQDAQEFLRFFLDALHDDTNRIRGKPPYVELEDDPKKSDAAVSDIWWNNYSQRSNSKCKDLFAGQLKTEVTCLVCRKVSRAFDPMWDLAVPIPRAAQAKDRFSTSTGDSCPLSACLQAFIEPERLDRHDSLYCSNCKKHQPAEKGMTIFRLPDVLVVQLKRFTFSSFRRTKITTPIDFPVKDLDISSFCSKSSPYISDALYDCVGVSNHSGSLGGGHYTADCLNRDDGMWHTFNDSHVSPTSASRLSTSGAYLLFYVKKSVGRLFANSSL